MATLSFPSLAELDEVLAATSKSINSIVDLIPSQYWFVEDHEQALESRFHKHKKRPIEALAEKHGASSGPSASKKVKLELHDSNSVTARQQAMAAAALVAMGGDAEDSDMDEEEANEFDVSAGADDGDDDNDIDMSGSDPDSDFDDAEGDGDEEDEEDDEEEGAEKKLPTISEWRAALEAARQTKNPRKLAKKAKAQLTQEEKRAKRKEGKTKQKKQRAIDQAKKESSDGQILAKDDDYNSKPTSSTSTKSKSSKTATSVVEDIRFGNIDFGDDKKKKKGPANKDVKAQLLKAEKEKERLAELQESNPEKAKALKERAAWKKAMLQASGEKVKDDTTLLKRAVKRKEKEKAKKKEGWAERKSTLDQQFKDKAKKRNENIQKKIDSIKAKNAKKRSAKRK